MKFLIRKYYSGYCNYIVDAKNEEQAFETVKKLPINYEEIVDTLNDWKECDEIEPIKNY